MDEKKSTIRYLYLCDSNKRIADGNCTGLGCRLFNECQHTSNEYYAKNSKENRYFAYYCTTYDKNGNIDYEYYYEIEKES